MKNIHFEPLTLKSFNSFHKTIHSYKQNRQIHLEYNLMMREMFNFYRRLNFETSLKENAKFKNKNR